ncbi:D-alanyl-D-alanine carboxypeptidase [Pseudonocardia sp. P1]|nr:D-alanyl-D-alanine carboxypeptidase [Pseudonocardia sp. Ae707_Ps1]
MRPRAEWCRNPPGRGPVGVLVAVLLLVSGCAAGAAPPSTAGAPPAAPTPTPSPAVPGGPPVLRTIDPAALQDAVDRTAAQLMIPGAVVEVRTPQGAFTATTGTTRRGATDRPDGATRVRIASITKTLTAAVVVQLAQEGRLRLDDPVSAHVPGVPGGGDITVADLLTMRSGLYGFTGDPGFAATLDADPGKVWTPQKTLAIAYRHPPLFPPGTAYDYSNTNYTLLGLVVEQVEGRPLGQVYRDRLLDPLGLRATYLPAAADASLPDPYSHGYMYGGSAYALVDVPYPPEVQAAARAGTLAPVDHTHQNPSYAWAAGGAVSTADDLAAWIRALAGGRVFDAAAQERWAGSPRPADPAEPDASQYGYGIERQTLAPGATMYFHFGEMPGYNAFAGHDPVNDVTLVIWSNLTVGLDGRQTANTLLLEVARQVYQLDEAPAPAAPTSTG